MTLNLTTTQEVGQGMFLRCFFYGMPGSGKTHLAGTFPAPLFLTPRKIMAELRTYGESPLTVVHFETIKELLDSVNDIAKLVTAGDEVGNYVPQTIVVDSLTEIQNMIQHEILMDHQDKSRHGNEVAGMPMMDQRDWGAMGQVQMQIRNVLYDLPVHIIWIGHAEIRRLTERASDGKYVQVDVGGYSLRGGAKHFIPNSCNLLCYMEALARPKDTLYCLYGKPRGIWNSRVHFPQGQPGFTRLDSGTKKGIHPSYDDLAPFFGLATRDDCEEEIDWDQVQSKPQKKTKTKTKQPKRQPKRKEI